LLNLAIINLDSYDSGSNDRSLFLWRAYVNIEYAILILKLNYNNDEIRLPISLKKGRTKEVIMEKSMMKHKDNNNKHQISRLKFILQHLNFQDKKVLLKQLRLSRDLLKELVAKR
jgi:hypothetical protein